MKRVLRKLMVCLILVSMFAGLMPGVKAEAAEGFDPETWDSFVKVLYRTFLGRDYDEAGLNTWVGLLDRGEKSRDEVMGGFAYSQEFENIMASYGL